MAKKEFTHIYHEYIQMNEIVIGVAQSSAHNQVELFEKSLVLTSDIKRLPLLLGGKLTFTTTGHLLTNMAASVITGLVWTGFLMNGTYDANLYAEPYEVWEDDRAKDDILLHLFGVAISGSDAAVLDIQDSHWDFEGKKILYDTITLLMFAQSNVNVATSNLGRVNGYLTLEIEVDWAPVSPAELKEFVLEHIYAKQGD